MKSNRSDSGSSSPAFPWPLGTARMASHRGRKNAKKCEGFCLRNPLRWQQLAEGRNWKLTLSRRRGVIESVVMQDKPLQIEKIEDTPGVTVLRLHGPLLLGNFFPLQTMVRADSAALLIVDVSDMPYIDSAGIGCLVGAHVSRENSGRKLVLVGTNERLLTSLKVTKVDQLFVIAPTVQEAMAKAS